MYFFIILDHFENFYCVIKGCKTFTLFPPSDVAFLPVQSFETARYEVVVTEENSAIGHELKPKIKKDDLCITNKDCPSKIDWIGVDVDDVTLKCAHPLRVQVMAGEVLYIPAMWFHRVSQTTLTISVNYWYDMRFDFRYVFFKLVSNCRDLISDRNNESSITSKGDIEVAGSSSSPLSFPSSTSSVSS